MLSDRLAYLVLLFERFVLMGLFYLCVFFGQRRWVFASFVEVCLLLMLLEVLRHGMIIVTLVC
ncbi:hypothetical protein HanHA300_Chr11g0415721 [Helianthus annuus]|nr:hypothetical protein HanHA300_Chr11g0415721 [Helianthus annuus]